MNTQDPNLENRNSKDQIRLLNSKILTGVCGKCVSCRIIMSRPGAIWDTRTPGAAWSH